ncbi:Hypothetical predicted protein [Podarcis lilfordi]|uniref:Uncharacterized protein n=1 Tax=Podarcis lilfordi TaxID=74358 RepID=A0AA35PHZ3_9SAUR|nr:Hypothetical predicted protein [Podarcis lilfordi]
MSWLLSPSVAPKVASNQLKLGKYLDPESLMVRALFQKLELGAEDDIRLLGLWKEDFEVLGTRGSLHHGSAVMGRWCWKSEVCNKVIITFGVRANFSLGEKP